MVITSEVFEAYLKCPTKSWLRSIGEGFTGNTYAEWVRTQSDFYCATKQKELAWKSPDGEFAVSPVVADILAARWRYATKISAQVATNDCTLKSEIHALELQPAISNIKTTGITPIRFVFTNKLSKYEEMLLAFDALVLAKSLGHRIEVGKIIHGDHGDTTRVNISPLLEDTQKRVDEIIVLLSSSSLPELVLNRHCTECEFQQRCRQKAKEADDLSLLSGMSETERARHRSKGIFTVAQLSYTFRPRRAPKRAKNPSNPHHFALQALAIREKCVYIHGTPIIPDCKCQIFLDIEGLPDREFYYLIGALVVSEDYEAFHSFWADKESDSQGIFLQFADLTDQFQDYRVFHYGDYDSKAIKHIAAGMPKGDQERFNRILLKSVNVLSLVFPHVYFPTYSNGLKAVAPSVRPDFTPSSITGLDSIVWRMNWELTRDSHVKNQLTEYNQSDCIVLKDLLDFIVLRISTDSATEQDGIKVCRTDELKTVRPHWQLFAVKSYALADLEYVGKCAYFDYQREKVFIRTNPQLKRVNERSAVSKKNLPSRPNKTTLFEANSCPNCKSRKLKRDSESSHVVVDLKFSKVGVRKVVTRFVSWRYSCEKCGSRFRSENRLPNPHRFGHALVSWCVYQNAVLGVNMSKVRKSLVDVFGLHLDQANFDRSKVRIASFYERIYGEILNGILSSSVLHIDETTIRLRKVSGYVWVFTTLDLVYYLYRPTREADFLHEMLASFRGVLVSDFYTGYDSLPFTQQKCIVHFVRDIDDDLLRNPYDVELKQLAQAFGTLLRPIIATVDRFGLRSRHLKKHKRDVDRFISTELSAEFTSQLAMKYGKRLNKYAEKMFTFLEHDGVPWNNNNAEHAIKPFTKYRRNNDGRNSEATLKDYLVLASVFETCEFNSVNVLKFLLSEETTVEGLMRMAGRKVKRSA